MLAPSGILANFVPWDWRYLCQVVSLRCGIVRVSWSAMCCFDVPFGANGRNPSGVGPAIRQAIEHFHGDGAPQPGYYYTEIATPPEWFCTNPDCGGMCTVGTIECIVKRGIVDDLFTVERARNIIGEGEARGIHVARGKHSAEPGTARPSCVLAQEGR